MDQIHKQQLEKSKKQHLKPLQVLQEQEEAQMNVLAGLQPPPEAAVSPPPRQYQQQPWQNNRRYPYYQQPYPNTPFKKPRFDQ